MSSEASNAGGDRHGGLFDSLKVLAASLAAIAHTRLELLSTEAEEALVWLVSALTWALAALFCAGLAIILAATWVVAAFWDTHRLLALGVLTGGFFLATLLAALVILAKIKSRPRLFAGSLAELSRDHAQLRRRA
ncbi:MAG: phage holin family protein [Betaproteobacteria bacterium]